MEINTDGQYGRPDYLTRAEKGTLNLHSLYLLLWANFGAFCLNLLTQEREVLRGSVISDYQAVRHYCKSQMGLMWLHMSTSLGLTDEQLSLLVVRSMQRMIQVYMFIAYCYDTSIGLFYRWYVLAMVQLDYLTILRVEMSTRGIGINKCLLLPWRRSGLR